MGTGWRFETGGVVFPATVHDELCSAGVSVQTRKLIAMETHELVNDDCGTDRPSVLTCFCFFKHNSINAILCFFE